MLNARLLELRAVNEDLQVMARENQMANGESLPDVLCCYWT